VLSHYAFVFETLWNGDENVFFKTSVQERSLEVDLLDFSIMDGGDGKKQTKSIEMCNGGERFTEI
jgi:hypothetical protein